MPTLREFSAWIVSEGKPLREYLVAVDGMANKVSCWIPSEAGKSFSVHWRDEGTCVYTCAYISLDGFQVPGRFLNGHGETSREGIRTGPNTERPFVFMEQSNASSAGKVNPDAGTVVLKIRRVAIDGSRAANKLQQLPEPLSSQSNMSHFIGYGEERLAYEQYPRTWQVKPHDGSGNRSYVTFVFRYRSRGFLLSQGIMQADDELQIPPQASATDCQVASSPLPAAGTVLITPSPTPSPRIRKKLERVDSTPNNAFSSGSVHVWPVNTVSMNPPLHGQYPGEGIIDFGASDDPNVPTFE